ncbi:helix-turn-helix domain-containing protein [Amycolatopsis anabasis]|uniref:helix-turn-helix domain-containing protein n=1 Tax=Amycolatopsis anabasis TaxID=1840409 RepID=UPI00131DC88F|nr:helix-turn-helix transcriptional regulator [Amycolatopsis anabasis]
MAAKRKRFAHRRKSQGFSQEALAEAVGVGRRTVVRWESGEAEPQPGVRRDVADTLEITLDELDDLLDDTTASAGRPPHRVGSSGSIDLAHGTPPPPEQPPGQPTNTDDHLTLVRFGRPELPEIDDDMNRRELLRLFSMTGTLLALPGTAHGQQADQASAVAAVSPAPATVDKFAKLNSHLWQVFALAASKGAVMPLVRKQLDVLAASLRRPHDQVTHQRLCALMSDLLQLEGEIFFDADRYTDAAHCYTLAADAGKEATAYDLWACAMTRHAFIAVYEQKFREAAPMLELAAALAHRGDPKLSTRHWVSVVQAETFAGLGDLDACQRALDTAEHVRDLKGPVHNGGWLRFDGSRLAEERGTCYITLGRPDLAETALNDALRNELTPRRRASVLTDLAKIGIHRRDPDHVLTHASAALETARHTGSGVIGHKLLDLRGHLAPLLGNKQVQQLDTEISALAGQVGAR